MRSRLFANPIRSLLVCCLLLSAMALWAASASAANAIVKDGNTIQLADVTYRLDGIDAPELDQTCIDDHADPWTCGVDARDQLTKLVGAHVVHCEDRGPDPAYKKRHLGVCTVEGEGSSLNQSMVRLGFAMNIGADKGGFADDEAKAKADRKGVWKGCLVAPQDFRLGNKDAALLGGACPADKDKEIRAVLYHQGQIRGARPRHRQCRHLSSAGLPLLPGDDKTRPLVLHRGRCAGGGIQAGV
jgi:endonuclease YncB( thermonuclease family)